MRPIYAQSVWRLLRRKLKDYFCLSMWRKRRPKPIPRITWEQADRYLTLEQARIRPLFDAVFLITQYNAGPFRHTDAGPINPRTAFPKVNEHDLADAVARAEQLRQDLHRLTSDLRKPTGKQDSGCERFKDRWKEIVSSYSEFSNTLLSDLELRTFTFLKVMSASLSNAVLIAESYNLRHSMGLDAWKIDTCSLLPDASEDDISIAVGRVSDMQRAAFAICSTGGRLSNLEWDMHMQRLRDTHPGFSEEAYRQAVWDAAFDAR